MDTDQLKKDNKANKDKKDEDKSFFGKVKFFFGSLFVLVAVFTVLFGTIILEYPGGTSKSGIRVTCYVIIGLTIWHLVSKSKEG